MRVLRDKRGREVITTGDPPKLRKGRAPEEIISTENIEEIQLRRRMEEATAKATEEAQHEDEK